MTFKLAQISDVHLAPITGFGLRHLSLKRGLGWVNWMRKRRKVHLRAVLDRLVLDMKAQAPDHIAVTGDLVNLGLPAEHAAALAWLRSLGSPDHVTAIPGNHDIYVRLFSDPGVDRWRDYMSGECEGHRGGFPFVRRFGRIALIGLNSALPRPPLYASGRLGPEQLQAVAETLLRLGEEGLARVVLIHHPPLPGQADARRGLEDAADLERVLCECGVELVLHGHNHRPMLTTREGHKGAFAVVGAPSASMGRAYKADVLAGYNLFDIDAVAGAVTIVVERRGLSLPDGQIELLERRVLLPAEHA